MTRAHPLLVRVPGGAIIIFLGIPAVQEQVQSLRAGLNFTASGETPQITLSETARRVIAALNSFFTAPGILFAAHTKTTDDRLSGSAALLSGRSDTYQVPWASVRDSAHPSTLVHQSMGEGTGL